MADDTSLSEAYDRMTAPGTVGGMFKGVGQKIAGALETPPYTPNPANTATPTATVPPQTGATTGTALPDTQIGANVAGELAGPQKTSSTGIPKMLLPTTQSVTDQVTSVQQGKTVPQALQNQQALAAQASKDAISAQAENAYQSGQRQAAFYQGLQDENDKIEVERKAKKVETDLKVKEATDKLQALVTDFQSSSVDDRKFFKDIGTGGTILAAIAAGLGALGAGLARTNNFAGDMIKHAIDQSIDVQKTNILKKQTGITLQNNLVSHFVRAGEDVDSAALAAKQVMLEKVKNQIGAELAQTSSRTAINEAAKMNAAIDAELANTKIQQELLKQATITSQKQTRTSPVLGGGFKDVGDVQEFAKNSPEIKAYKDAREVASNWKAAMDAGADGVAVSEFIATGLKQGSFNENFVELLRKRGMIDKAGNFLREKFVGGYDPALLRQIGETINGRLAAATKHAEDPIKMIPAPLRPAILGTPTAGDKAQALGGKQLN